MIARRGGGRADWVHSIFLNFHPSYFDTILATPSQGQSNFTSKELKSFQRRSRSGSVFYILSLVAARNDTNSYQNGFFSAKN